MAIKRLIANDAAGNPKPHWYRETGCVTVRNMILMCLFINRRRVLRHWAIACSAAMWLSVTCCHAQPPAIEYSVLEVDAVDPPTTRPARTNNESRAPLPRRRAVDNQQQTAADTQRLNEFLTALALEHMPHEYADDKDWGRQEERWDGIDFRRDGLKIRTHRKKKMVNHGTWQKYSASLINPERQFRIRIENAIVHDDGSSTFDVACRARLKLDGRQSKWVKGVQLYSVGIDGHATIRLTTTVRLNTTLDFSHFPPDVIVDPLITDAKIDIEEFRIDRVGKAGGEVAQQISRGVRKKLEQKVAAKEKKLVVKLNKKIDDNREKLRLSMHDSLVKQWTEKTGLPSPEDK